MSFLMGVSVVVFRGAGFTVHDFTINVRVGTYPDSFGIGVFLRGTDEPGGFRLDTPQVRELDAAVKPLLALGRPLDARPKTRTGTHAGNVDISISRFGYTPGEGRVDDKRYFGSFNFSEDGYVGPDVPILKKLLATIIAMSGQDVGRQLVA